MSEYVWVIAIVGLLVAIGAEIDISLHRRDHDRRRKDRRKGDVK